MAKQKSSNFKSWAVGVVVTLALLSGLSGLYTNYKLYWQTTGVTRMDNGKPLNRAQLVDLLIVQAVQKGQTK